jgi:hypothetical protein
MTKPTTTHPALSRDERIAMRFWVLVIGFVVSFLGAIAEAYLRIDVLRLDAALIGASLGAVPVLFFPAATRIALGRDTRYARRDTFHFRAATVAFVVIVVVGTHFMPWSRPHHTSPWIGAAGFVVATLASWFLPHFPTAVRRWLRGVIGLAP